MMAVTLAEKRCAKYHACYLGVKPFGKKGTVFRISLVPIRHIWLLRRVRQREGNSAPSHDYSHFQTNRHPPAIFAPHMSF